MVKRISIIGPPGSGKSTLATQLGALFDLPVYHLDAMFWKPGWVESEREEFNERVRAVIQQEHWVIDGNYSATLDERMRRADLIVFLDFPRRISLFRVIRRWKQYAGQTRPDMGAGCDEKIDLEFVRWIWNFPKHSRPGLVEHLARWTPCREIHWLHDPGGMRRFLSEMHARSVMPGGAGSDEAAPPTPAARQ